MDVNKEPPPLFDDIKSDTKDLDDDNDDIFASAIQVKFNDHIKKSILQIASIVFELFHLTAAFSFASSIFTFSTLN